MTPARYATIQGTYNLFEEALDMFETLGVDTTEIGRRIIDWHDRLLVDANAGFINNSSIVDEAQEIINDCIEMRLQISHPD